MSVLFKNGSVYSDKLHKFVNTDLYVKDGVISEEEIDPSADTVDCTGKFLIPGLVDVHTHGRGGVDFNNATAENCKTARRSYALAGTTTVMATLASAEYSSLVSSADAINKNRKVEAGLANIAGIHLEGRYLALSRRGAHAESLIVPPDADEVETLITRMLPLPVHISAAFELDTDGEFLKKILSLGATAAFAHSDTKFEEAESAVERGVTAFTHTYNAMRPMHHREPGCVGASLMLDSVYTELIADGFHVHPAMIDMAHRLKQKDKIVLITDSMEAAGCADGNYSIAGLPVKVKNGLAVNEDGAIAGSTVDLFTALKNYMRFTNTTLEEALPAATANPAKMVGIYSSCGTLSVGRRADIIIINDKYNPEIESVWIAGENIE